MIDLFDYAAQYPNSAGYKTGDTSREAAEAIEDSGRAETLRAKVLEIMAASEGGLTADECAHILGEDILSIRPRFSELKARKALVYLGKRRTSDNGKSQRVLVHRDFAGGGGA